MIVIGTAGWSIPKACAGEFPAGETHLYRYARTLRGVEINSSFHRSHSPGTYARWARQTPRFFKFAVKLPRRITHDERLRAARRPLQEFLAEIRGLGGRLGPLLVQLPPSLNFEPRVARGFFGLLRALHDGPVVCEPRHPSWFEESADRLLVRHCVGRVASDPAVVPAAAVPGGWPRIVYYRLHGSPRKYWSTYDSAPLAQWARALKVASRGTLVWCVLDNTAAGGAALNALQLRDMLKRGGAGGVSPARGTA